MEGMQLRADATVLRRREDEVQIGTDPRWAVVLTGLSPAQVAWVCRLRPGAAAPPSPNDEVAALVTALTDALMLVPRGTRATAAVRAAAGGNGDVAVLSALRPDAGGRRTLEARARRTVAVSGLGRLGAMVASTLATAGVGALILDDHRVVRPIDLGPGAYALVDVGTARDAAVRRIAATMAPSVVTDGTSDPDVVVMIEERVANPDRALGLMSAGIPHLGVEIREADVVVGPFVLPGRSPCLRCIDLHRSDIDPTWPQVSLQLRAMPASAEETVLAVTGAAITAGQVLAALDGAQPRTAAACIEIPAPDAMPRQNPTAVHPACGCTL